MKSFNYYRGAFKIKLLNSIYKRKGWTTDRRIIVIESDDWGSIRMPSISVLNKLLNKNVILHPELGYDKFDTLASNDDLELLMEVLHSVKDIKGNPAKITLNSVMANPDFKKIKESYFSEFHYELFTETLKRYPNHNRSFNLWKEGISHGVFRPQFHAREHLNVQMWMKALNESFPGVRDAFECEVFSNYIDKRYDNRGRFLEAYNIQAESEYKFVENSIVDGLKIFENIFGFESKSVIAPNYIWDDRIENCYKENKIKYIQGINYQRLSRYYKNQSNKSYQFHVLGERNIYNQIYLTRNCFFEPSSDRRYSINKTLKEIDNSFKLNKPSILCSHRLNFIGGLNLKNRDYNLKDFKFLLKTIINKYPDVEFMFSDELGNLISNENNSNFT